MTNLQEEETASHRLVVQKSRALSEVKHLAKGKRFRLQDYEFQDGNYAHQRYWAPPNMSPFFYLKAFQKMTRPQQLRYNQLFALGILEKFIWFKGELLGKIVQKMAVQNRNGDFKKVLEYFLEDGVKHSEMFWQILQHAAPEIYPERNFYLFQLNPLQEKAIQFLVRQPDWNLAWVWMAIFFEERTLDCSLQYAQLDQRRPGTLDSRFVTAHRLHLTNESRHFQMDLHFLKHFYGPATDLQKKWASFSMKKMMGVYTSPRRVSHRILKRMKMEFPDFSDHQVTSLRDELDMIKYNKSFLKKAFG